MGITVQLGEPDQQLQWHRLTSCWFDVLVGLPTLCLLEANRELASLEAVIAEFTDRVARSGRAELPLLAILKTGAAITVFWRLGSDISSMQNEFSDIAEKRLPGNCAVFHACGDTGMFSRTPTMPTAMSRTIHS